MKLNQLMAELKGIPNDHRDLPIQVYDFTDSWQITGIGVMDFCYYDSTIQLVTSLQTKKATVKEFISALDSSVAWATLEVEIFSPDKRNQHILAGVEFDRKNQTYAITLGDKIPFRRQAFFYDI